MDLGNHHIRSNPSQGLTRETIIQAFQELSEALANQGITGEICLFGGAVMVLAFTARIATKDVDAIFHPSEMIREWARRIGQTHQLPEDWLNDGVKGFVSVKHETTVGTLPQFPNLRLAMPTPEYLLAMKCMASRISTVHNQQDDVADIIFLIRHLGLKNAKDVMEIVAAYYPENRIPIKAQYLVEALFEENRI